MTPWTVARQAPLSMDSPGKNTGVGSHSIFQGIFLIQGLNLGLPHCNKGEIWLIKKKKKQHLKLTQYFKSSILQLKKKKEKCEYRLEH